MLICNVCLLSHTVDIAFTSGCYLVKQAVPIRDPVILSKIHQTYRIGYIKVSVTYYFSHPSHSDVHNFAMVLLELVHPFRLIPPIS